MFLVPSTFQKSHHPYHRNSSARNLCGSDGFQPLTTRLALSTDGLQLHTSHDSTTPTPGLLPGLRVCPGRLRTLPRSERPAGPGARPDVWGRAAGAVRF